ncbi:glycoside hydrolase family 13 protein [Anaerosporobacter faecicola]|uniref:glycoside hydrolase family 13 protein n=1 Tax=Anaerosporobacter faecicola TaxID=2718714 RepID=UPI001439C03C|nr:alpha-glucosidase [Anaerosporobacter faecicola]
MGQKSKEKTWWKESVVYQIYPRSFQDSNGDGIGDLQGIIRRLPYLQWLGIDVIWLSPIFQSPNDDNGYDISDYQAIMNEFGTMEDFDELLRQAHEHGLKIMLDLVVNHSSDEHAWFMESRKSKENPYRDYYIWREGKDGKEPNNWGGSFGGSAWKKDETTGEYYLHTFSPKQPDLNWDNKKLREEVFSMMRWWLDKGVDGFRMDVINMISKVPGLPDGEKHGGQYGDFTPYVMNGPHVHEYLQEMNKEVLSKYDVITVGEAPAVTVEQAKQYVGFDADELNMVFQFEHMCVDEGPYGKWTKNPLDLVNLKNVLSKWQTGLDGIGWNSLYWNNHDQPRIVSRWGNDGEYHDKSAKMLGTCLHLLQGTPYIYQGEEIGMTNVEFSSISQYRDIECLNQYKDFVEQIGMNPEEAFARIQKSSRDNARTPMQWNGEANGGFTEGTPWIEANPNYTQFNVEIQRKDKDSVLHYYRKLIRFRKEHLIVIYGTYESLLPKDPQVFAYKRKYQDQELYVLCNFSKESIPVVIPGFTEMKENLVLWNDTRWIPGELSPYEARVYLI